MDERLEAILRHLRNPNVHVDESEGALLAYIKDQKREAWNEGREAGLSDYDDRMPDATPNPYATEA